MAIRLPGPDTPPGKRRKRPKVVTGTTTVRSVKPKNPKIVWYGKNKPKLDPNKFTISKRGGGLGYVATRKPVAPAPAAAPAPTGPYSEYAAYPWAQQQLKQLDTDQKFHQTYVSDKVAPWLSQSLTNLTGVDPNSPGANTVLQQQYLANVAGPVGGALSAAAAAGQAPNLQATTPGGVMASPTQYMSNAASEGARGMASSYLQSAQLQSQLNTLQPNLMSQSYVMQLADYAKGLPAVYAEKRSELRGTIDQFISKMEQEAAQQAETLRHNRVTESISAMNAETQAALGFGNLGVSSTRADTSITQAATSQARAAETARHNAAVEATAAKNAETARQRAIAAATGGGAKALTASAISSMNGKWKGGPNNPPKLGAGWKQPVWDPGTKAWYAKRAAGSGGGKPSATTVKAAKGTSGFDLKTALQKAWDAGTVDTTDQDTATKSTLLFLRKYQPTNKANFAAWWKQTIPILAAQDPNLAKWMVSYRQKRVNEGTWKGSF
jgi:hypothetical protein